MKKFAKVLVCLFIALGLTYAPVYMPILEDAPAIAVAEAATVKINKKSATTFYSQTFDAKTPIAKMNDAELEDFLIKVYRSGKITSIIDALNKELL